MKRACILYKREDAEKNGVLIRKYFSALAGAELSAGLLITDRLPYAGVLAAAEGAELVINRTRDFKLARFLERAGLFVSNPAFVNETANDKLLTFERLSPIVPMLDTRLIEGAEPPFEFPFVAKPAGGHGGRGVTLVSNENDLAAYLAAQSGRSIAQPLATDLGRDMRVYVIGGRPAAAMLRVSSTDFRSNFSLGGRAETVPLSALLPDERSIVEAVCRELPLHYAGVDIMRDRGRAVLNEIEDPVGARMLYINTDIDPAALHVKYCLDTV